MQQGTNKILVADTAAKKVTLAVLTDGFTPGVATLKRHHRDTEGTETIVRSSPCSSVSPVVQLYRKH